MIRKLKMYLRYIYYSIKFRNIELKKDFCPCSCHVVRPKEDKNASS